MGVASSSMPREYDHDHDDDDDWGEGDSCRGDHNDRCYCIQPTTTDDTTTAIMNVAPYRLVDVVVLRMMMMLMKIHKA
jgi:hypothetical protein